jgi:DNA-binding NtrC family response regulator
MRPVPVALKGDTAKALELIEQARPLVQPFPREKAIFFENLGLIYLLDNQLDQAKHALEQGMEISLKIAPESTLVSQIGRLQADVALAGNDHASARTHLERALTVAEQVGERLEIAACWRVQAELSAHDGDHARATDLYRRAIDLLKQIGARYELAVTQYRAAVSGLFAQGERLALLHLAREYFESENVTPYLERIDTELSRTPQSPGAMPASNQAPVVVASSKAMKKTVTLAAHIAQSDMTVLLTGETGTGKDLLARYIHHCSGRTGDFVAVNTAAVPNEMVEAELFGFTRGAFTGAERDRVGLVQQAHEGTLYLNEIADATAEFQAKLLEVLESKAVRRLGENEPRNVNVRIIAATNRDLHQWLSEGRFRLDLYHRLNEVPIHLPPLRDRSEDIRPLTQAFLEHEGVNGQLDEDALTRLEQLLAVSAWPGNVRQLQAELRRLWMTANGDIERLITLVAESADRRERANLITLLDMADWNRREVARRLGVSEAAIRKRMARYEIAQEVVGS